MLAAGTRIDAYELVRCAREDAVSVTWLARSPGKNVVALTRVRDRFVSDPNVRESLLTELRIAATLENDNVAAILDMSGGPEHVYVVTEATEGLSVGEVMARRPGPLPPAIALRIAADVCGGLHAAHRLPGGLVHGNVSADSVIVGVNGEVKLVDFGIAVVKEGRGAIDAASDLFATGLLLHRMLSGRPPPSPLPGGTPAAAVSTAAKAVATDPRQRFTSALAMRNALEGALAEIGEPDLERWARTNASPGNGGDSAAAPGFLDVGALVARRSRPETEAVSAADANGSETQSTPGGRGVTAPKGSTASKASRSNAAPPSLRKRALAVAVVFAALAGLVILAPGMVRDRVIESAREAGLEVAIDRVRIGLGGVTLEGVRARPVDVPGVLLRADEIASSGITGRAIRVRGFEATMTGKASELAPLLSRAYERARGKIGTGSEDARHIDVASGSVSWREPFGQGTSLSGNELSVAIVVRRAHSEELHASLGNVFLKTERIALGPWAASFESTPGVNRTRLHFDPPVPDGPSALLLFGSATAAELTVRVPRSPLPRLGIRASEMGLPADDASELEVTVDVRETSPGRVEGDVDAHLFAARMPPFKSPVDLGVRGRVMRAVGKPIVFSQTTATVGPFPFTIDGTVDLHDSGFRLDAAFRMQPIPCERIARAEAKTWGPLAVLLQELGQRSGAARVTGTAQASGNLTYDTREGASRSVSYTSKAECGLSLFSQPP